MLRPRGGVNGIAANGCFHLFGGEGNPEHPYGIYPDHDYYNPVTDTWHRLENMPIAIHGVTGLAFLKGLIHLPGGGTAVGGSSGSTIHQVYKPAMSCK
jgi:N-acetylneuraminic acid mutarotase